MDKVLDKLGLYDIIAILLSGMVITAITNLIFSNVYSIALDSYGININDTFMFLIVSYFMGLLFQELGSLFQELIQKIKRDRCLAMYKIRKYWSKESKSNQKSYKFITKNEYELVLEKLKEVDISKDKWDDNTIYYYCKQYREKEDSNFLEKLQSLAGMSRSFTVYFICMFVISMFILFYNLFTQQDINILQYIVPFATMILSIIFYLRFIRFIVMRYTKIYRGFLYSKIMKKA